MATVRFGDVAERVNTKEDRLNTDLVYYVGGEHIESNALTVSGRGKIKEADLGPMFYFGFKPGDILFVTRNPHLRKCATVDFSGICSEKTLVIGTKDEDVLSQKYLATVMQSDDFWEFMEENKSGSVNYFINWSTLADYEFDLPPIERQRELANLLWAANDLKESYKKAITATDEMLKAKFREMFGDTEFTTIDSVCEILNGYAFKSKEYVSSGVRIIRITNVQKGYIEDLTPAFYPLERSREFNKFLLRKDDLLMSLTGNVGRVGLLPESMLPSALNQRVACLRIRDDSIIDKYFLYAVLNRSEFERDCIDASNGSAQKNASTEWLKKYVIPLPPLSLQREFVAIAERADAAKSALKQSIADIEQVMKGLING